MQLQNDFSFGIIPYFLDPERSKLFYFVGRQHNNSYGTASWKFPKGHKEEGEQDLETALRETREEIGISLKINQVATDTVFTEQYVQAHHTKASAKQSRLVNKINRYYLGRVGSDGQKPEINLNPEFTDYQWLTAQAVSGVLADTSQTFFPAAHNYALKLCNKTEL